VRQRAAAQHNTLQHTATLCSTLQHTATYYNRMRESDGHAVAKDAHYNTLQHSATHCNILQHTATQFASQMGPSPPRSAIYSQKNKGIHKRASSDCLFIYVIIIYMSMHLSFDLSTYIYVNACVCTFQLLPSAVELYTNISISIYICIYIHIYV